MAHQEPAIPLSGLVELADGLAAMLSDSGKYVYFYKYRQADDLWDRARELPGPIAQRFQQRGIQPCVFSDNDGMWRPAATGATSIDGD